MRWFAALTTLNLIETLVFVVFFATWITATFTASVAGVPVWIAVVGLAAIWFAGFWWLDHRIGFSNRLRDFIFHRFGFSGPAPSRPNQEAPKLQSFFIGIASALLVTFLMALPFALSIGPLIGNSLVETAWLIVLLELVIGAPITLIGFNIAEGNARVELGVKGDRIPPPDDDLADQLREKWKNEIDQYRKS